MEATMHKSISTLLQVWSKVKGARAGRKYIKFYFIEFCCHLQEANKINNIFFSVDFTHRYESLCKDV